MNDHEIRRKSTSRVHRVGSVLPLHFYWVKYVLKSPDPVMLYTMAFREWLANLPGDEFQNLCVLIHTGAFGTWRYDEKNIFY